MKIKSYPKVNLFLLIGKKNKKKNLHKIFSIFVKVKSVYDLIEIETSNDGRNHIIYFDNCGNSFQLNDCIFQKTINLLKKNKLLEERKFFKIKVTKNIPICSGLGAGSSNAAEFIKYLLDKKIIKMNNKLKKTILKIGSDIFFFLKGFDSALVYGFGNKIKKINFWNKDVEIIFTNIKCETKKVFDNMKKKKKIFFVLFLKQFIFFKNQKYNLLINELEESCFFLYPDLQKIKTSLEYEKDKKAFLSGSGGTLFFIK